MVRKDAYFFPHYANSFYDPDIMLLRCEMGLEGYALWWVFLELCRNENTGDFPFSLVKQNASKLFAMYAGCENDVAKRFFDACIKIGLMQQNEHYYYSENFVFTMEEVNRKRLVAKENGRKGGRKSRAKPPGSVLLKQNESKIEAVKERKVKETKLINKRECASAFDAFWNSYGYKKSKGQAEKVWQKIDPDEYSQIIDASGREKKRNPTNEYRQHPSTWLNAKGWLNEDEELPVKPAMENPDECRRIFENDNLGAGEAEPNDERKKAIEIGRIIARTIDVEPVGDPESDQDSVATA